MPWERATRDLSPEQERRLAGSLGALDSVREGRVLQEFDVLQREETHHNITFEDNRTKPRTRPDLQR